MNCPNCNQKMHVVKLESHYGLPIVLDQCKQCGGLWFDKEELFMIKKEKADKLGLIDSQKLKAEKILYRETLSCPQDGVQLKLFSDPNFPKELKVESCPSCGGFWFNRGEFQKYHQKRKERQKKKSGTDDVFERQIEKLLESHSEKEKYNTLGRLGQFLSTPMYSSGIMAKPKPLYDPKAHEIKKDTLSLWNELADFDPKLYDNMASMAGGKEETEKNFYNWFYFILNLMRVIIKIFGKG